MNENWKNKGKFKYMNNGDYLIPIGRPRNTVYKEDVNISKITKINL